VILYLDASALVRRYIQEKASQDVNAWIEAADMVVTGLITRVEVAAAIARAGRMKLITPDDTLAALRQFRSEWESFQRLPITENTVVRGDALAVEHNLRGYDATHLACALIWQETLGMPVTLASFDGQLIEAARGVQMAYLPSWTEIELLMR
jgi:predicted nucleic acid-binding protein